MEVYEITGYRTGISEEGVNFLQPSDSFQKIENGFIYRQVLQSRMGVSLFAPRLADESRVFGIFEHILPTGEKELLAADQNFLYSYDTTTGVFVQIPFGGSLAAYPGFNVSSPDLYISGTSYPNRLNAAAGRFVFTGEGITLNGTSAVFFYDGSFVYDFTDAGDNPDYTDPLIGGVSTPLNRAKFVFWFGERLNFISPTIGGVEYEQGVLYSGIRNTAGNGDKFDVAGSGMLQADTYETITGCTILGQVLAINFFRSNWTLEKTTDAFNPYFIRKVPSVLGTNANFSAVSWNNETKSMGKTGLITTDGRQSLRFDNKIPNFTADEISQTNEKFNLTYGGFDRINNQFLWAYLEPEVDFDTQNKVLVYNYEENSWSKYDQRFSVFGQTEIGRNLTWDDIYELNNPSWLQWDTTEEIWNRIGIETGVQKTLAGDDFGFIYQLNQDFDDYFTNITAITQAAQAVLTVDPSAFQIGDLVTVQDVQGMTEINNFDPNTESTEYEPFEVVAATPTSITLNVDSTTYSAYTTGGSISKVISFKAETIPFNPYRNIGRKCHVSYVEILIDTERGGSLLLDVFEDEEETPFKDSIPLIPSSTTTKAREWITVSIDNEANFMTFVMRQQSPAAQARITSMRIHCEPGGLTSG